MTCPRCGAGGDGNYCAQCGARLRAVQCPSCGASPPANARFCTSCGTALHGGRPGGIRLPAATLGWATAGLLMVGLLVFLAVPVVRGGGEAPPRSSAALPPLGPAANVDLSSMTPREAADRLFNRVVGAAERGDSGEVRNFLPMAVGAYDLARPLDADGAFHLSLLQRMAGDFAGALATARAALEDDPDHLLNLSAAAEAAREMGDAETARGFYSRVLEVFDRETESGKPEYGDHARLLPEVRASARTFVEGR